MARIEKNAVELARLIRKYLAEPNLRVAVYPTVNGWRAKVYDETGVSRALQKRVDDAAEELSAFYDLGDGTVPRPAYQLKRPKPLRSRAGSEA